MAQSVMPAGAVALMQGQGSNEAGAATGDGMLKGVCDIHLHCRPDSRERSADEFGFMQDAVRAGYRAVMFKSNDFSCHDRAYLIREMLPGFEVFGSLCMNRVHGEKVNVFAAQKAVRTRTILNFFIIFCFNLPQIYAILSSFQDIIRHILYACQSEIRLDYISVQTHFPAEHFRMFSEIEHVPHVA